MYNQTMLLMDLYVLVPFAIVLGYIAYKVLRIKTENDDSSFEIAISAMRKNELLQIIENEPDSSSRRQQALERFNKYFAKIKRS